MSLRMQIVLTTDEVRTLYDLATRERRVRVIEEREAHVLHEIFAHVGLERWSLHRMAVELMRRREPTPRASVRGELPGTDACLWRACTVQRIIRDSAYRGETLAWQWRSAPLQPGKPHGRGATVVRRPEEEHVRLPEGVTPPIVSPELWLAANHAVEAQDGAWARNVERPYLLRGRILCAICTKPLQPSWHYRSGGYPDSGRVSTYRCSSHRAPNMPCAGKVVPADAIDAWAREEVTKRLRNPGVIAAEVQRRQEQGPDAILTDDLAKARREVARCEREQHKLVAKLRTAEDTTSRLWSLVEAEVDALEGDREDWQKTIRQIEDRMAEQQLAEAHLEAVRDYCARVSGNLEHFGVEERRLALDALTVTVTATGKDSAGWDLDGAIPLYGEVAATGNDPELIC